MANGVWCLTLFMVTINVASADTVELRPGDIGGALIATYGRALAPEEPRIALGFEPKLNIGVLENGYAQLKTSVLRPTDQYERFQVPRASVGYFHQTKWSVPLEHGVSLVFVDLDRWNLDGAMVRVLLSTEFVGEIVDQLFVSFKVSPFVQLSDYRTRADGSEIPAFGLSERIGLDYRFHALVVRLSLGLEQRRRTIWKNDYATAEQIGYALSDHFQFGLRHELLSNVIDETSGTKRAARLFDGRESRFSGFVEMTF